MGTLQWKACLVVIKNSNGPLVAGVAGGAIVAQGAQMHIIIGVTAHAVVSSVLELVGRMATAAGRGGMHPGQRERRKIMIECYVGMPFDLPMTRRAVIDHLSGMTVIQ